MKQSLALPFLLFFLSSFGLFAQKISMTNAHSHNDYEQVIPFYTAYQLGFYSIEVDLFYQNNELFAAHEPKYIQSQKTFKSLYLNPIIKLIAEGKINTSLRIKRLF